MTTRYPCMPLTPLCLLAFTASASAECAWVLWQREHTVTMIEGLKTVPSGPVKWTIEEVRRGHGHVEASASVA